MRLLRPCVTGTHRVMETTAQHGVLDGPRTRRLKTTHAAGHPGEPPVSVVASCLSVLCSGCPRPVGMRDFSCFQERPP